MTKIMVIRHVYKYCVISDIVKILKRVLILINDIHTRAHAHTCTRV